MVLEWSYRPLLSGYDEPETLPYQITLFGPIGADVRQKQNFPESAALTFVNDLGFLKIPGGLSFPDIYNFPRRFCIRNLPV